MCYLWSFVRLSFLYSVSRNSLLATCSIQKLQWATLKEFLVLSSLCYRKSESTGNGSGSGDTGTSSVRDSSYHHIPLTEEVLLRHNADMQKIFIQRQKGGSKPCKDRSKLKTLKTPMKKPTDRVSFIFLPTFTKHLWTFVDLVVQ